MDENSTAKYIMTTTKPGTCEFAPTDQAPSAAEVIQQLNDIGAGAIVYMMVPVLLFVVMSVIYIEEAIFIIKTTQYWRRTQHKLWILSGFPVISGLCVVGLFFPRSSPTIQILISFYNALCMKEYFAMTLHYYGGKKKMAEITNEIVIPPNPFPCIIFCCLKPLKMNVRTIKIMQYLISPVTVYQPIVFFILTVLWNEGLEQTSLSILLTVLNLSVPLASFVAVYGFVAINKASEESLRPFRIRLRFISVQLILAVNTVQMIIMLLLDRFRAMPCGFPYQNPRPAFMVHLYMFPAELFILSIAARYAFRFSEKGLTPIVLSRNGGDFDNVEVKVESTTGSTWMPGEDGSLDSGCLSLPGIGVPTILNSDRPSRTYSPSSRGASNSSSHSSVELKSYRETNSQDIVEEQNGC